MPSKMLGSEKSEGFVPIHDQEQNMGSFDQEQGTSRGFKMNAWPHRDWEDSYSEELCVFHSSFCFQLFGSDAAGVEYVAIASLLRHSHYIILQCITNK